MILARLARQSRDDTIRSLYGVIVAQARHPLFYAAYGVPETLDGRFDMIVLHLCLVMRRLRSGSSEVRAVSQRLFDLFCSDMEHNLREIGVSDLSIPKEMRRLGEAFYGRAGAYDRALDAGEEAALAAVLGRNVFAEDGPPAQVLWLAAYVRKVEGQLALQEPAELARGILRWPEPGESGAIAAVE